MAMNSIQDITPSPVKCKECQEWLNADWLINATTAIPLSMFTDMEPHSWSITAVTKGECNLMMVSAVPKAGAHRTFFVISAGDAV
jgi:hypothetical protein